MMPFEKIQSERLAEAVVRQIERLVLRGVLVPGARLPSERDLSTRLGVSRPILRDAIAELEASGILIAKAGAGVFVADIHGSAFSKPLIALFSRHGEAVSDYVAFRRDLEAMAAERAARLGSDADLAVIDAAFTRMQAQAGRADAEAEATLDAAFHMAIVEAAHNVILLQMVRSMFGLLREGVFYNRAIMFGQKTTRAALLDQHGAINAAIQARDPAAARAAVEAHLDFVASALADHRTRQRHEGVAQQRLAALRHRDD